MNDSEIYALARNEAAKLMQPILAKLDHIEEQYKELRQSLVQGKGSNARPIDPQDLREFAVARIASTDLGEIVAAEAERLGMSEDEYCRKAVGLM
ncbi:hypothetical protein [Nitrososphaera sp.]|uniref:hypothetical protein n=1 Tax=Nitrososphaera sp. TaxID=1971748 RepID=UPI00316CF223